MSRKRAPKAPAGGDGFLGTILRFLDYFRSIHPTPDDLVVKITLPESGTSYFRGLRIDSFDDAPGFVMLRGIGDVADKALVVRAEQVLSAEFLPWPEEPQRPPIGFAHH